MNTIFNFLGVFLFALDIWFVIELIRYFMAKTECIKQNKEAIIRKEIFNNRQIRDSEKTKVFILHYKKLDEEL